MTEYNIKIVGNQGPVAQLLHPCFMDREDLSMMSEILGHVENKLSKFSQEIKLVLSGGGFIELRLEQTPQNGLKELIEVVNDRIQPIVKIMKNMQRDYVIGIDTLLKRDNEWISMGQFAVPFIHGRAKDIVWKSFPTVEETNYLAGFGTKEGLQSPRCIATELGNTMILVCNDVQVFNRPTPSPLTQTNKTDDLKKAINYLDGLLHSFKPHWALNLIHWIEEPEDLGTFLTSFRQITQGHFFMLSVVGAFGYETEVYNNLEMLATKARFPFQQDGIVIIVESPYKSICSRRPSSKKKQKRENNYIESQNIDNRIAEAMLRYMPPPDFNRPSSNPDLSEWEIPVEVRRQLERDPNAFFFSAIFNRQMPAEKTHETPYRLQESVALPM